MKPEARVFDIASQSIFCCIVVIYYCIVLFTKLVCKLFKVGLVVNFFWKSFSHVLVRDGCKYSYCNSRLEFQEQSKKSLL